MEKKTRTPQKKSSTFRLPLSCVALSRFFPPPFRSYHSHPYSPPPNSNRNTNAWMRRGSGATADEGGGLAAPPQEDVGGGAVGAEATHIIPDPDGKIGPGPTPWAHSRFPGGGWRRLQIGHRQFAESRGIRSPSTHPLISANRVNHCPSWGGGQFPSMLNSHGRRRRKRQNPKHPICHLLQHYFHSHHFSGKIPTTVGKSKNL